MKLKVLGSSSSGNCYLIEANNNEKLILDAGVNFKIVQKKLNFNFNGIEGVLVTHEHMDHLKYASNFALYGINIYASAGTFKKQNLVGHRFKVIKALQQFEIGNFIILPFDTKHDAAEPLGFLIQYKKRGTGVAALAERAFYPRAELESCFPWAKGRPWLLPAVWCTRAVKAVT